MNCAAAGDQRHDRQPRRYASVNEAARASIKPEILNGPSYYWPEGTKLWWLHDFNDAGRLYERVWLELKGR